MEHPNRFSRQNFKIICDKLAARDEDLKRIIDCYGYPPMWCRKPTFKTLVHIILEQQVSLASALAALKKLQYKAGSITAKKILSISDEDLRACYFSRQKISYVKDLAINFVNGSINLKSFELADSDKIKIALKKIKGIGDWSADVFLMLALQSCDHFPIGDIALVSSIKLVKRLPENVSKDYILSVASAWQPYRTIASFLLWHAYLQRKKPQRQLKNLIP